MELREATVGRFLGPSRAVMVRQFVSQVPVRLVVGVVLLVVVGFAYGVAFAPPLADVRPFLRGLASVQASFVGVVFAVTVLGIQLIESRHSARMSFLFYAHPVFVITLGVIVASIGLDLLLIAVVAGPTASGAVPSAAGTTAARATVTSPVETGWVYAAGGLALGTVLLFATFLRTALSLNAPEETLDAFRNWVTPDLCVAFLRGERYGPDRHHPLFPLYRTANRALEAGDHETAELAVDQYCELTRETVKLAVQGDTLENPPSEQVSAAFDPVIVQYGPQLAVRASAEGKHDIAASVVSCIVAAGDRGLDSELGDLDERTVRGLRNLHEAADDDRLTAECRQGLGTLLTAAARKSPSRFRLLLGEIQQFRDAWGVTSPATADGTALEEYVSALVDSHRELLHAVASDEQADAVDWSSEQSVRASPRPAIRALWACWKELYSVTVNAVERIEAGKPRLPTGVLDGWRDACTDAGQLGPRQYAVELCGSLVVLVCAVPLVVGDGDQRWLATLERVRRETDPDLLRSAFESVEERSFPG